MSNKKEEVSRQFKEKERKGKVELLLQEKKRKGACNTQTVGKESLLTKIESCNLWLIIYSKDTGASS